MRRGRHRHHPAGSGPSQIKATGMFQANLRDLRAAHRGATIQVRSHVFPDLPLTLSPRQQRSSQHNPQPHLRKEQPEKQVPFVKTRQAQHLEASTNALTCFIHLPNLENATRHKGNPPPNSPVAPGLGGREGGRQGAMGRVPQPESILGSRLVPVTEPEVTAVDRDCKVLSKGHQPAALAGGQAGGCAGRCREGAGGAIAGRQGA